MLTVAVTSSSAWLQSGTNVLQELDDAEDEDEGEVVEDEDEVVVVFPHFN